MGDKESNQINQTIKLRDKKYSVTFSYQAIYNLMGFMVK